MKAGILIFDGAEELDFVGPWEVLTMTRALTNGAIDVVTVAKEKGPVRAAKGLSVLSEHSFATAPDLDVLVIPGGDGARDENTFPPLVEWIAAVSPRATWVTSVCTGALLLQRAGLLRGKRATTHWRRTDELEAMGGVTVVRDARYVRDGNVVTAAGVSAGIDMTLWLVGQLFDPETARKVQRMMEYDPTPPYQAAI